MVLLENLPPEMGHTYLEIMSRISKDQPPFRVTNVIPFMWASPPAEGLKIRVPVKIERIRQTFIDALEDSVNANDIIRPHPWLFTPFTYNQTREEATETLAQMHQRFPSGVKLGLAMSVELVEQQPKSHGAWTGRFKFSSRTY